MKLLLMDTCGTAGTVAVAEMEVVLATTVLPGRSASERLVPAVRELMEGRGWRLKDLEAIVVVTGPGSFTGVRVGLSAAKAMSDASGVGLVGVSRLQVLAAMVGEEGRLRAVLDAGRGEFYFGEYLEGECVREALMTLAEVLTTGGDGFVVACEMRVTEALEGLVEVRGVAEPGAGDAVGIAAERVRRRLFDDTSRLDANYLRRTDEQLFARPKAGV